MLARELPTLMQRKYSIVYLLLVRITNETNNISEHSIMWTMTLQIEDGPTIWSYIILTMILTSSPIPISQWKHELAIQTSLIHI